MTTYEPPRPWIASYAEGVPDDLEPVTGSLVDIVEASARDYPDAPALQFFGRTTSYRELNDAIERAAAGLRDSGVAAGRPGRDRAAELPAAHRRVLRDPAPGRRRRRAQPALHAARAAQAVRRPRREARDRRGRRSSSSIQDFPADLAVTSLDLGRHHQGDAVRAPGSRCACPIAKARESRAALHERVQRHGHVGDRSSDDAAAGIPPEAGDG